MAVWSLVAAIIVVLAFVAVRRRRSVRTARVPTVAPPVRSARQGRAVRPPRPVRPARPIPKKPPQPTAALARSRMAALSDVDDPVTATATLVHAVAGPAGWPRIRAKVHAQLAGVTSPERAGDAIMFAEWAVRQGLDEHHAIDALAETLGRYLGQKEMGLVIALLDAAAAAGGPEAEPYAEHAKAQLSLTAS